MTFGRLAYIFGWLLVLVGAGEAAPAASALLEGDTALLTVFAVSGIVNLIAGGLFLIAFERMGRARDRRVAFLTPVLAWVGLPAFAAIPIYLSGEVPSAAAAFFEAASAMTTTGGTVLEPPLPGALALWRAQLCWFGGLATLVTIVAIYAVLNIGGASLFYSALSRGEGATLMARMRGALVPLLRIYLLLTALCMAGLWVAGLAFFDALSLAMSAVSTAGMTPWGSAGEMSGGVLVEAVVMAFMLASAVNITLYAPLLRGRAEPLLTSPEARMLLVWSAGGALVLAIALYGPRALGMGDVVWQALFMAVSALTTSGFRPDGMADLPLSAGLIVLTLVFIGGSLGSTSGGLKIMRVRILIDHVGRELARLAHPHSVRRLRFGSRAVEESELSAVFLTAYTMFLTVAAGTMVLAALDVPYQTAGIVALVATANAGPIALIADPGFAGYHELSSAALWLTSLLMILGRLETALVLTLFIGAFWRR